MVRGSFGRFVVVVLLYLSWSCSYSSSGDVFSTYYSASTRNCSNPSCLALAAQSPNCTGILPWIGDGYCDPDLNNSPCGYDGGDCCEGTCVDGPDHTCGENSFSCMNPDGAKYVTDGCVEPPSIFPCPKGTPQHWVVEVTVPAQALAPSMSFSGGVFEVAWNGNVVVDSTFYVVDGTVLNITGNGPSAGVHGTFNAGLFVIVNDSLHVIDISISHNGSPIEVFAAVGSGVVLSRTAFIANTATGNGGAVIVSKNARVYFAGEALFSNNSAAQIGGGLFAFVGLNASFARDTVFSENSADEVGGAVCIFNNSNVNFAGGTPFPDNSVGKIGGPLAVSKGSSVSFAGGAFFQYDFAFSLGGALFIVSVSNVFFEGNTFFPYHSGGYSGAVVVFAEFKVFFVGDGILSYSKSGPRGGAMDVCENSGASRSCRRSFLNNVAQAAGAALHVSVKSSVTWSGETTFSIILAGYGGALNIEGASFSWSGVTVWSENSAKHGGAVFFIECSSVSSSGRNDFVSNNAEFNGGAVGSSVYDSASNDKDPCLGINGPTNFAKQTCGASGGELAVSGALPVTLKETTVVSVGNSAGNAGGGVYFSGAVFATRSRSVLLSEGTDQDPKPTNFDGYRIIGNNATATGGATEAASGKEFVNDSLFMGNTAGGWKTRRRAPTKKTYARTGSFAAHNLSSGSGMDTKDAPPPLYLKKDECTAQRLSAQHSPAQLFSAQRSPAQRSAAQHSAAQHSAAQRSTAQHSAAQRGMFLDSHESRHLYNMACDGCGTNITPCSFEEPLAPLVEEPLAPLCRDVMEHATSSGGATTIELVSIDRGYWRATTTSVDVLACYNADACLGGVTGTSDYCSKGYKGPYCSVCSDGYVGNLGFSCTECVEGTGGIVLAVAVSVIVLFAAVVIVTYLVSGELEDDGTGFLDRARRYLPLKSIKIVVVVWQIITQFTAVTNVTYPDVYQRFLDGVDVLNFDLSWIISAGCVVDTDFHDKLLMSTIGPIFAMILLGATYTVAVHHNSGSEDALRIVLHKHVSMAVLLTSLIYSSVSSTLFQMYVCDNLDDGKNYLRADYRIECDSSKHKALLVYTGFMIALYTVGIPALYVGLLFRSRDVLKDNSAREDSLRAKSISDLWKPYKPTCFYYEVIECARRMLLAGAMVFIYPDTAAQVAGTLMIAMFFVFVSEGLAPYELRCDRWVNRMGHAIVLTSMNFALLLKVDVSKEQASSQKVFGAILVSAHACMVLTVVAEAVATAWRVTRETQKETEPRPRLPMCNRDVSGKR